MTRLGLCVVALALGSACSHTAAPPVTVDLVSDLTLLATGRPLASAEAERVAAGLNDGRLELDRWLDNLVEDPALGDRIAKGIVLGPQGNKAQHPVSEHLILRQREEGGQPIYYLREACTSDQAEKVSPWWAPESTVLICPDSYRPEVRGDAEGRACGATTLSPRTDSTCGCGPRLIFCTRDRDQYEDLRRSVQAEVDDTLAFVVNQDLPLEQLFLMNETVRDRNAEFLYRRARILAGEPDDLVEIEGFGSTPRLAPRHEQVEGQQAGILSTPSMIYVSDALRGTMRQYYDYLWCTGGSSSRVTTAAVLGLAVVNLREGDGWKQLAGMDICTDCHARLDYGMQFFSGYPSSTRGIDYLPALAQQGSGPLYGANIGDPRGEAPLNPLGFARLALSQPEFGDCMTDKVVNYVMSGRSTPDDFDAVRLSFEDEHSVRAMLRTAMRRAVLAALAPQAAPSATVSAAPPTSGALSTQTQSQLESSCLYCHDGVDAHDLGGPNFDRLTLLTMLEQVSFQQMPPTPGGLYPAEREALVEGLIAALWDGADERASARSFYQDGLRAYPAHPYRTALATAAKRAGSDDDPKLRSVEPSVSKELQRVSPGFAASVGLAALQSCKEAGQAGEALARCVREASEPEAFVVGDVEAR